MEYVTSNVNPIHGVFGVDICRNHGGGENWTCREVQLKTDRYKESYKTSNHNQTCTSTRSGVLKIPSWWFFMIRREWYQYNGRKSSEIKQCYCRFLFHSVSVDQGPSNCEQMCSLFTRSHRSQRRTRPANTDFFEITNSANRANGELYEQFIFLKSSNTVNSAHSCEHLIGGPCNRLFQFPYLQH